MDGTDQVERGIPGFVQKYKSEGSSRIMFHELVAVVGCGPDRDILIFDSMEHIPHNPNLIIDALQKTLKFVKRRDGGVLPDTLYVQFDNCFRENKNAYMSAFLAMLIGRRVFKRIYMSFLPVGHTHDIVDQVNSRLSVACRNVDLPSRKHLLDAMRESYTPRPHVFKQDKIADFKSLVNPEGDEQFKGAHIYEHSGITGPLYFCFELDASGKSSLKCKDTLDDDHWGTRFYPFREHPIPVHVRDISGNDFKVLHPKRLEEIEEHIDSVSWRDCMNEPAVQQDIAECLATITDPSDAFYWEDDGCFRKEGDGYDEVVVDQDAYLDDMKRQNQWVFPCAARTFIRARTREISIGTAFC